VSDPRCRVQTFHHERNDPNPFGSCKNAWLKVRAPLIKPKFLALKDNDAPHKIQVTVGFNGEASPVDGDCIDANSCMEGISHGDSVLLALWTPQAFR
jgi:hypothetical protein